MTTTALTYAFKKSEVAPLFEDGTMPRIHAYTKGSAPSLHCDEKAHLGPYPGFGPAIASNGGWTGNITMPGQADGNGGHTAAAPGGGGGSGRQADGKPGPAPAGGTMPTPAGRAIGVI